VATQQRDLRAATNRRQRQHACSRAPNLDAGVVADTAKFTPNCKGGAAYKSRRERAFAKAALSEDDGTREKTTNCSRRNEMAAKEVKFSVEARDKLLRGIDILANAVRVTLGPKAATSCSTSRSARRASPRTA
jgi:hypothetical protein